MLNQSKIFLKSEGNSWYKRNKPITDQDSLNKKPFTIELEKIIQKYKNKKIKILDIGCANGRILNYLKKKFPLVQVFGLEPSKLAIKNKLNSKINMKHGDASKLPYYNNKFDLLIYCASLMYTDSKDLFKIVYEANRVSKQSAHIAILDFYSKDINYVKYKHKKGIFVRKMDYSKIFLWHPFYSLIFKKIYRVGKYKYLSNLTSIFILKKITN